MTRWRGPSQVSAAAAEGVFERAAGVADTGIAQATAGVEPTQAQIREGMEKLMKTAEEFVAFSQGNVEAVVKSGQIWTAGVQDLSKQMAATAQASFEETLSTFRAMAGVKSLKDAIELQTSFARSAFEKSVAESGRFTDATMKLAEQAIAPLTARVTLAVETFAKSA